jgi:uncharacterized protein involved in high-affinity Fe2+ transport
MGINMEEAQRRAEREQRDRLDMETSKLITPGQHANIALCAAIRDIIHDPKTNGYAKGYAETYFHLHRSCQPEDLKEAQRVQILYILNNITHWRGNRHSEIRKLLKEASK